MPDQPNQPGQTKRFQCRHIFTDGRRCGSPSLRREPLCYYHHTTRRPIADPRARLARHADFTLPLPEDRSAIQLSIGQVLQRIAANQIDPKRAGLLLYGLQIASLNLPREAARHTHEEAPAAVEEVIEDPTYGPLAPESELAETQHQSVIRVLLENLKDYEEEQTNQTQQTQQTRVPHPERAEGAKGGESTNPNPEPNPEPIILENLQAKATPKPTKRCRPTRIYPQKSAKKLTRLRQIAIVRRFREYSGRAVGETQHAEGREKPRSLPMFSAKRCEKPQD